MLALSGIDEGSWESTQCCTSCKVLQVVHFARCSQGHRRKYRRIVIFHRSFSFLLFATAGLEQVARKFPTFIYILLHSVIICQFSLFSLHFFTVQKCAHFSVCYNIYFDTQKKHTIGKSFTNSVTSSHHVNGRKSR